MPVWIPYQPPSAERALQSVATSPGSVAARRASLIMLLIALLLAGGGGLLAAIGRMLSTGPIQPELQSQMRTFQSQTGMTFAAVAHDVGLTLLVVSVVVGVLGIWVRRGRLLPIILALIVDSLTLLLIAVALVRGIVMLVSVGGAQVLAGLSVWIIALAVCGLLFSWLVQAAGIARQSSGFTSTAMDAEPSSRGMGYGYSSPPPVNPQD